MSVDMTRESETRSVAADDIVRLSPADIDLIDRVAQQMISANLWRSIDHRQDVGSDLFEIYSPGYHRPVLSVGVLATHRYFYMDHRDSSVRIGGSLAEVLDGAGVMPSMRPSI